jgi:hypothetical protein
VGLAPKPRPDRAFGLFSKSLSPTQPYRVVHKTINPLRKNEGMKFGALKLKVIVVASGMPRNETF